MLDRDRPLQALAVSYIIPLTVESSFGVGHNTTLYRLGWTALASLSMGLFRAAPTLNAEIAAWKRGLRVVAGVDEAGCGPLAGPLVAGAAILDPSGPQSWWSELRDSKLLPEPERDRLAALIRQECAWGIGVASHRFIDEYGLTAARLYAMRRAVEALPACPDVLLIDAMSLPEYRHRSIIHGDALVSSIAAAAIVAKVARDAMMTEEHERYPQYGFASNRGYATPEHKRALDEHGPCVIHRRLFAPVREALEARGIAVDATELHEEAPELAIA